MPAISEAFSYTILTSPMLLVILAIIGVFVGLRRRNLGFALTLCTLLGFGALATPFVSSRLMAALERNIPDRPPSSPAPDAIVVLSGDAQPNLAGQASSAPGLLTLERVYLAAEQARRTHLPILVTGGGAPGKPALADLMATTLEQDFGTPVRWRETQSRTTFENAQFSAAILKQNDIATVLLVTQRWHMPRAIWAFHHFGIVAVPVATPKMRPSDFDIGAFLPSVEYLGTTSYAIHEFLGLLYYRWVLG